MPKHPSHKTRFSFDASTYDEICELCGATDQVPGGWGLLAEPCPAVDTEKDSPTDERDALARLEAWQRSGEYLAYCLIPHRILLQDEANEEPLKKIVVYASPYWQRHCELIDTGLLTDAIQIVCGTNEHPPAMGELIHVALDEWEQRCKNGAAE